MEIHFNSVINKTQKKTSNKKNTELLIEINADYSDNQEKAHIRGS